MRARRTLTPLLGAILLASWALPATASGHNRARGIDVSNHQGTIRWSAVPNRQEFVFVKATEGADFRDPAHDRNRRRARKHGKLVGAYHFARPDGRTKRAARRDARREARFFLRVASPRRGELRPVLDIEVTGGLPPGRLIAWAKTFVKRVGTRVDAPPMLYTTPSFWRTAMNNTKWFARHAYRALWIAHWETREPNVPAGNWAGRGWTFWQYTSCGSVKGIEGCVDKNQYRYRSFRRVKIL